MELDGQTRRETLEFSQHVNTYNSRSARNSWKVVAVVKHEGRKGRIEISRRSAYNFCYVDDTRMKDRRSSDVPRIQVHAFARL